MILLSISILWITQPPHLRHRDVSSYLVIVAVIKFMFFLDGQRSMNFETDEHFLEYRGLIRQEPAVTQVVPLVLCVFLENKIARHYNLGYLHRLLAHGLTGMLVANYWLTYVARPVFPSQMTPKLLAQEKEYAEFLALIGNLIYLCVIGFSMATIFHVKMVQGKSWDNVSVRVGFFVVKAAMLVGG